MSFPLTTPYAFVTPKIGVHMTRYNMEQNNAAALPDSSRVLPTFTADSGLLFERGTSLFGKSYTQTLEPKLYYVYIPYRDQSRMPNFESGVQDINFATIYSENQFSGNDRINDANQITLGVNSRLINPDTGVGPCASPSATISVRPVPTRRSTQQQFALRPACGIGRQHRAERGGGPRLAIQHGYQPD
jgi:LPS-assembly protein